MLQVENLLPPATTALPYLRLLTLSTSELCNIPVSVASKLKRLVKLDLSCNSFTRLPPALSQITTLEALDLSQNLDLELVKGDANILSTLASLTLLVMEKQDLGKRHHWSAASVREIVCICKMLPQLDMQV